MSSRKSDLYLRDIQEAIVKIENFTKNMSYSEFCRDEKTIDAVVRNIEVIGEAASHLPSDLRLKYPSVPWKQIVGTRAKVIHEYFGVDLEIIWKTIKEDLLVLNDQVIKMLEHSETPPLQT